MRRYRLCTIALVSVLALGACAPSHTDVIEEDPPETTTTTINPPPPRTDVVVVTQWSTEKDTDSGRWVRPFAEVAINGRHCILNYDGNIGWCSPEVTPTTTIPK